MGRRGISCVRPLASLLHEFSGVQVGLHELIAELPCRIEALNQLLEIAEARVPRLQLVGGEREQLSPVWARLEGLECRFDPWQHLAYLGPLGLPREVDGKRWPLVCHAHPQHVRRDGAHLSDEELRRDVTTQLPDCPNRCVCKTERDDG